MKSSFCPTGKNEALRNCKHKANVTRFEFLKRSYSYKERCREDKEGELPRVGAARWQTGMTVMRRNYKHLNQGD